ncbi:MAG: glucose 1-dehydrogenase 2 [Candidatus Sericytochromatia bacterium]|nr:MAG: glucose 1-dehydrogenase 2 [Candidatus Sericytochromatia bacterium]
MNLEELKDQTILITGSAKRIAKSIVLELSKYKPRFVLHYRNSYEDVKELLEEIKKYNSDSYYIKADFSIKEERESFLEKISQESIDIVINSASIFPKMDYWKNFEYELFIKIFDVNLFTPASIIKTIFKNNKKGLVINFLDASLKYHYTDHFIYRLSKYSLEKLTYMLAKELAPYVRVNAISPGAILPPAQLNEQDKIEEKININEFYEKSKQKIPLNIPGNPEYIVQAIKFIIENDFITGVNIPVDGGEFI